MALREIILGSVVAALIGFASLTEAKKTPKPYGTRQEYFTAQSGDQYTFFCWGPLPDLSDKHNFAMMKSTPPTEGQQCVDHFYFKEGNSYCSFEHSKRKSGNYALNQDELAAVENHPFNFAPPVQGVYRLFCTSSSEVSDLPSSAEGRREVVFKDSAGKVCTFMGMPSEESDNKTNEKK